MRPTRFDLMLQYAREFILEWFDQNPLGQIGVVGMRAGLGERIGDLSGGSPFLGQLWTCYHLVHVKVIHKRSYPTSRNDISSSPPENPVYKTP